MKDLIVSAYLLVAKFYYFSLSLVIDPTVDWTVRHGCAIALSAVLHDAPDRLVSHGLYDVVTVAAISHATTDRVSCIVGHFFLIKKSPTRVTSHFVNIGK